MGNEFELFQIFCPRLLVLGIASSEMNGCVTNLHQRKTSLKTTTVVSNQGIYKDFQILDYRKVNAIQANCKIKMVHIGKSTFMHPKLELGSQFIFTGCFYRFLQVCTGLVKVDLRGKRTHFDTRCVCHVFGSELLLENHFWGSSLACLTRQKDFSFAIFGFDSFDTSQQNQGKPS